MPDNSQEELINLDAFFSRNPLEVTDKDLMKVIEQEWMFFAEFKKKKAIKQTKKDGEVSLESLGELVL